MKKIIKLVTVIIFILVIFLLVIPFVKKGISTITSRNSGGFIPDDYAPEDYNELGLDTFYYGETYALNGNDFDEACFCVNTKNQVSEDVLATRLTSVKEKIQNEDIKNTYKTLLTDEENTPKDFEKFDKTQVGFQNALDFENQFFSSFEDSMKQDQNYLLYTAYNTPQGHPFLYGYIKGLGHIIGAKEYKYENLMSYVFSIENKYFSRIVVMSEKTYNKISKYEGYYNIDCISDDWKKSVTIPNTYYKSETWYSNNDLIKAPVTGPKRESGQGEFSTDDWHRNTYLDYQDNMIMTTAKGFFNKDLNWYRGGYPSILEGEFACLKNPKDLYSETTHLWGLKYSSCEDGVIDDGHFFRFEDGVSFLLSGKTYNGCTPYFLTDFANYYAGNVSDIYEQDSIALFGKYANNYMECLLDEIFDGEIYPCNDFEEDTKAGKSASEIKQLMLGGISSEITEDIYWYDNTKIEHYSFFASITGLTKFKIDSDVAEASNDFDGWVDYLKITTEREADYFSDDKFWYNRKQLIVEAEFYEKLVEKPYLNEYAMYEDKITCSYWSLVNRETKVAYQVYDAIDNITTREDLKKVFEPYYYNYVVNNENNILKR